MQLKEVEQPSGRRAKKEAAGLDTEKRELARTTSRIRAFSCRPRNIRAAKG